MRPAIKYAVLNSRAPAVSGAVNIEAPELTSSTAFIEVDATLTTSNGTWSHSPSSYAYQWQRGGVDIAGATSQSYVLVTADAGTTITCVVTATGAAGSASASSDPTSTVLTRRMVPTDFANLAVWYDPNDPSGIVESGGFASQLTDLSGNGRHLVQATGSNQPSTSTSLNGTKILSFTGTLYMLWSGTNITYSGWSSAALLMPDFTSLASSARAVSTASSGNGDSVAAGYVAAFRNSTNNAMAAGVVGSSFLSNHAVADDTWCVICAKRNVSTLTSRCNGTDEQVIGSGTGSSGLGRVCYGAALASSGALGTIQWKGSIASFALLNAILVQADMQKLEAILAWRANSSSILDAGHPYKTAPPRI